MTNEEIHLLAQRLRIDSIRAAAAAASGHPTSSMSGLAAPELSGSTPSGAGVFRYRPSNGAA